MVFFFNILGPESSCFIFSFAYTYIYIYIYMFSMLSILERESLDIEKICQISNIVYVQNFVNKYSMRRVTLMPHLLSS